MLFHWVVLANVIAWPVTYFAMRIWVRDLYYRAPGPLEAEEIQK